MVEECDRKMCVCVCFKTKWVSHWKHVNVVIIINTQKTSWNLLEQEFFLPVKLRKYVHASNCFFMFPFKERQQLRQQPKRNYFPPRFHDKLFLFPRYPTNVI